MLKFDVELKTLEHSKDSTTCGKLFKNLSSIWKQEEQSLLEIANKSPKAYQVWVFLYFLYEKTFLKVKSRISAMNDYDRNVFEVHIIEQVFESFEIWKGWCQKHIYNSTGLDF